MQKGEELCWLYLYKARAAKELKEMKKGKKSKAQYRLGEDGLEGFRVSGRYRQDEVCRGFVAARVDVKC